MKKIFHVVVFGFLLVLLFSCKLTNNSNVAEMKTLASQSDLNKLIEKYRGNSVTVFDGALGKGAESAPSQNNSASDSVTTPDHSETNNQVSGVDEADVVKTDGEYIYVISQGKVQIVKAYPVENMELVNVISYEDSTFYPNMLFVYDKYLVVVGNAYEPYQPSDSTTTSDGTTAKPYLNIWWYGGNDTRVIVYEKGNYTTPVNDITIDGYLVQTRMVDNQLLLITNQYLYYNYQNKEQDIRPKYEVNGNDYVIDYEDIHYQEDTYPNAFVSIMKFDVTKTNTDVNLFTYLGSSNVVYVSEKNIYISQMEYYPVTFIDKITGDNSVSYKEKSIVTKIPYTEDLNAVKSISINGYINNQFSMDEYNGNFRVTTTSDNWISDPKNNLYIYDENLKMLSKIEGIAKGERIQSTRFVSDRIYVVTFRQVDPFFVIDASNPNDPKLLGELKIPGFSTYLQPYDENHVIGFGFDATDTGRVDGLKMSLFDVTDPKNPVEQFKNTMPFNESYSYSELTYNHKALLFDKTKNLFAFPLATNKYVPVTYTEDGKQYTTYQYFYKQSYMIYKLDLNEGFQFKLEVCHNEDGVNQIYYRYGYEIMRGLYIDNYLYTVSQAKVLVHSLNDYSYVKEVTLDFKEDYYGGIYYPGIMID